MKTTEQRLNSSEARAEQVASKQYQRIELSIDWHAREYRVVRIIEGGGPEPAQRFSPVKFEYWVMKQLALAEKVYSCYEAGAGGFVLHRWLTAVGVINYMVAPRSLDRDHRGVQNDATDALQLAQDLDRYVRGNKKALRTVYVPSVEEEQKRQESRQRQQLLAHRKSLAAQGRSLLLAQGHHHADDWWKGSFWKVLGPSLPSWLRQALETYRRLILVVQEELDELTRQIEKAAAVHRPVGMGALTFEQLQRELCNCHRFTNRKQPGSYAGLCGGLSASGSHSMDLPITKAGNRRLRVLLIEWAWRMVRYQPQSVVIQRWAKILLSPKAHRRLRKKAIVAVARGLLVQFWQWQTGRTTPEQLGWRMT